MTSIGPQLPPELQKRKRDDGDGDSDSSSDSFTGPLPPRQPVKEQSPTAPKRARVLGPSLPPAPLNERPSSSPSRPAQDEEHTGDSESDDDGFGPSLPPAGGGSTKESTSSLVGASLPGATAPNPAPQRDEWMTLAPSSGDWSARVDPTKLKNRKFNTGRGAKGAPQAATSGGDSSWHETPEQKQARLNREVMGIQDESRQINASKSGRHSDPRDDATARRLKEYNETQRGPSLYASHSASLDKPVDDDPSARAFDREKDIGSGSAITATKRRDMVQKAAGFSSRFEKAKYL